MRRPVQFLLILGLVMAEWSPLSPGQFTPVTAQAQPYLVKKGADVLVTGHLRHGEEFRIQGKLTSYDDQGNVSILIDGETGLAQFATEGDFYLELGDDAFPLRHWNGTDASFYTDNAGNVFIDGRVDWGEGSRLVNDYIELEEFGGGRVIPNPGAGASLE